MHYCSLTGEGRRGVAVWLVAVYSLCEVWQTLSKLLYGRENVNSWDEEINEIGIPMRLWLKELGLFISSKFDVLLRRF
jgi:hypothetical protein